MSTAALSRSADGPRDGASDRPLLVALLLGVFVLAIAVTILRSPEGVVVSADPGYAPRPVPLLLVPTFVAIVLTVLLLASLLFGLMHATSHGEGPLWASAAQAVAMQGTTGIALGMMWRRWRRLWVCILAHVLLNGFVVLLHLLGVLG